MGKFGMSVTYENRFETSCLKVVTFMSLVTMATSVAAAPQRYYGNIGFGSAPALLWQHRWRQRPIVTMSTSVAAAPQRYYGNIGRGSATALLWQHSARQSHSVTMETSVAAAPQRYYGNITRGSVTMAT